MNIFKTIKNATKTAARKTGAACRVIRNEFVAGYNKTAEVVSSAAKAVLEVPSNVWACTKDIALAIKEHWTVVFQTVLFDCKGIRERSITLAGEVRVGVRTVLMAPLNFVFSCFAVLFATVALACISCGLLITAFVTGVFWAIRQTYTLAASVCGFLVASVSYVLGLAFFTGYAAGEWIAIKVSSLTTKQAEPALATAA